MDIQFTKQAEEVLLKVVELAESSTHSIIIPEHMVKVLIDDIPLDSVQKRELLSEVNAELARVGISTTKPSYSQGYLSLINSIPIIAKKFNDKYCSIDHIMLALCESPPNLKTFMKNLKEIESEVRRSKTPSDSRGEKKGDGELPAFAVEMVQLARDGKFDPVMGRENEIRSVIEILSKKTKCNPILIGNPGVGKTAIVNEIATMIANNQLKTLEGYKIYSIDIGSIVAGTGVRGEFEERFKRIIKEACSSPRVILFIDEIHMIVSAGSCGGSIDAANMLKPGLASGEIKCIGATTYYEYRKYVEKDPALVRRFVRVNVGEPLMEDSITMLRGLRERIEAFHGTRIMDQAIVAAVKMAKKYVPGRMLPDSAIDLLDTACASAVISVETEPQEALRIRAKMWSLGLEKASLELDFRRKIEALSQEDIEKYGLREVSGNKKGAFSPDLASSFPELSADLSAIQAKIASLNESLETCKSSLRPIEEQYRTKKELLESRRSIQKRIDEYNNKYNEAVRNRDEYQAAEIKNHIVPNLQQALREIKFSTVTEINQNNIAEIVSRWTGIPVSRLNITENERLLRMEERIRKKIFGQENAVSHVCDAIITNRTGLSEPNKPIGSFLFLGPTGVGKTELAKALCYEMFDNNQGVVIDMSDYSTEISVTKLIGVSAGYVGYDEGGRLTEPVKNKPYNLVIFDEIDLAHPSVFNILYQLLDEGRVVDGKGAEINFTNCVVIMTSNLGYKQSQSMYNETKIDAHNYLVKLKKSAENEALNKFGPALINRIDAIVHFNPLSIESTNYILDTQIIKINERLAENNITIQISDSARAEILRNCVSEQFGARPLKKYLQRNIVNALAKLILMNKDHKIPEIVLVNLDNKGVLIGDYFFQRTPIE
ncbi:hypothetical protein EDEG_00977 [Edhazardia aedis USNM 41457]|uniref:ATP-dependent chaperone ClpB n=1 Tax=Edhazardia aedis (strain USNM 41457) TaxID=1003232 RepID=J9DQJ9_EDHAE|nr:hypothetical protein EDEG_00977 [Edhazardia aedis USNM 41457]|eukprot:EJW04840.1 hypothetical protein EDEG_00977 [Edhazardia aedis USNM 41457]